MMTRRPWVPPPIMKTNFAKTMHSHLAVASVISVLIAVTADFAHSQGTVISISGPAAPPNDSGGGYNGELGVGTYLAGVAWSSTAPFSDVNISVALQGNAGATGVAYLMTSTGPGTTTANQVAEANFAFPGTSSLTPVLSGLDLGAGIYVLIIQQTATGSSGNGVWLGTTSPTVTAASNVIAGGEFWNFGSIAGYAPASDFGRSTTTYYDYTATSVPEPSATFLVLLGGGIAVWRQSRVRGPA